MVEKKAARLYIRADPEWLERVKACADALSLDVSAYVTLAVSERMQRDQQATQPQPVPKRRKKK